MSGRSKPGGTAGGFRLAGADLAVNADSGLDASLASCSEVILSHEVCITSREHTISYFSLQSGHTSLDRSAALQEEYAWYVVQRYELQRC